MNVLGDCVAICSSDIDIYSIITQIKKHSEEC